MSNVKQLLADRRSLVQRARIKAARAKARVYVEAIFENDPETDAVKLGRIAAARASRASVYQGALARRYSLLLACLFPPLLIAGLTPANTIPYGIAGFLACCLGARLCVLHPVLHISTHRKGASAIFAVLPLLLGGFIAANYLVKSAQFTSQSAAIAASSFVPAYAAWRLQLLAPRFYLRHPLDLVFLDLLLPASALAVGRKAWASPSLAKALRARLRGAASMAESAFLPRAAFFDLTARQQARAAGLKLAVILSSRNELITTAASANTYDEVGAWLADGVHRWLKDDLDEVLRLTPAPNRRVRTLRVIRWGTPLVILIAAAFALPEIPPINHASAGTASWIRASLLVSAALYLGGVPISAGDQVMGIMSKVNGIKGGS